LNAAHAIATRPRKVWNRLRSNRMRASTGKAVMLMAAPMNRENVKRSIPTGARRACTSVAKAAPRPNGTKVLVAVVTITMLRIDSVDSDRDRMPTINMNRIRPISLSAFRLGRVAAGNKAANCAGIRSRNRDGPSINPATISPMTAGWWNRTKTERTTRDAIRTIAT